MGRYSSYLEKSQKASFLLLVSSLTHWWKPYSISLFPLLSLSGALDIYAGENYYFSISRSTQKKGKKASPTWPVPLIYSQLYSFPLLYPCLHLFNLLSPLNSPPHFLCLFLLPHSFPCLSVCLPLALMGVCVCAGWTAGGAELVGEAENGLRSQNPGSSLMGGLAWLPAASVHQLRPIIWRGHIWPGLARPGLVGTPLWWLESPPHPPPSPQRSDYGGYLENLLGLKQLVNESMLIDRNELINSHW